MARVPDFAILLAGAGVRPREETMPPPAAFADFLVRHEPGIRRLAHRLLGWPKTAADVDDVVQDVMLQAWRHQGSFRGESLPSTWLVRVAINTARNHQRRHGRLRRLFVRADAASEPAAPMPASDFEQRNAAVRAAMARLRHEDREILVLRYLEQLPIERLAATLAIGRNALDVRLSRARARLRRLLAEAADG